MDMSYSNFEKIIKSKNLTAYKVAKDCGISRPIFTYWKQGRNTPSLKSMVKIANYLNVSIEELIA